MSEHRKFLKSFVLCGLMLFLVWSPMLVFNVLIDPYGVFLTKSRYNSIEPNKRYIKVLHVCNNPLKYNSFIFGSSRVNAINPTFITSDNYYNMSYSSGSPVDHLEDLKYMLKKGVIIKNLLVGIDYMSLIEKISITENDLLRRKFPETISEKIGFYKNYIFNSPGIEFMKVAISRNPVIKNGIYENGNVSDNGDSIIESDISRHVNESDFDVPASRFVQDVTNDDIDAIQGILLLARANKINLTFFINPIHYKTFLELNLSNYYNSLYRLSKITSFFDFGGINSVTIENRNYYETSHYRRHVGDMILGRLFKPKEAITRADFGVYVDSLNIHQYVDWQKLRILNFINVTSYLDDKKVQLNLDLEKFVKCNVKSSYQFEAINGNSDLSHPIHYSSPLLIIEGTVSENDTDVKAFIEIDSIFFPVEIGDTLPSEFVDGDFLKRWQVFIPTNRFRHPFESLKLVFINDQGYNYSDSSMVYNLRYTKSRVSTSNLDFLGDTEFHIDNISNSVCFLENEKDQFEFFLINGWATDIRANTASGGVVADVNGQRIQSQFVYRRPDLVNLFSNSALFYAGWGLKIPIRFLIPGENLITYQVLNNSRTGYYVPMLKSKIFNYGKTRETSLKLPISSSKTKYSIDRINNIEVRRNENPIRILRNAITISGWAVDDQAKLPAAKVYISIDTNDYEVVYGLLRPDVAKVFDNKDYEFCGWNLTLPVSHIGKGKHQVGIKITSSDGSAMYIPERKIVIEIL